MTYDELTLAATRLPPSQRLALIETLTRSLRREFTAADEPNIERLEPTLQVDITQVTIPQASDQPTEDPWEVMDRIGRQLSAKGSLPVNVVDELSASRR